MAINIVSFKNLKKLSKALCKELIIELKNNPKLSIGIDWTPQFLDVFGKRIKKLEKLNWLLARIFPLAIYEQKKNHYLKQEIFFQFLERINASKLFFDQTYETYEFLKERNQVDELFVQKEIGGFDLLLFFIDHRGNFVFNDFESEKAYIVKATNGSDIIAAGIKSILKAKKIICFVIDDNAENVISLLNKRSIQVSELVTFLHLHKDITLMTLHDLILPHQINLNPIHQDLEIFQEMLLNKEEANKIYKQEQIINQWNHSYRNEMEESRYELAAANTAEFKTNVDEKEDADRTEQFIKRALGIESNETKDSHENEAINKEVKQSDSILENDLEIKNDAEYGDVVSLVPHIAKEVESNEKEVKEIQDEEEIELLNPILTIQDLKAIQEDTKKRTLEPIHFELPKQNVKPAISPEKEKALLEIQRKIALEKEKNLQKELKAFFKPKDSKPYFLYRPYIFTAKSIPNKKPVQEFVLPSRKAINRLREISKNFKDLSLLSKEPEIISQDIQSQPTIHLFDDNNQNLLVQAEEVSYDKKQDLANEIDLDEMKLLYEQKQKRLLNETSEKNKLIYKKVRNLEEMDHNKELSSILETLNEQVSEEFKNSIPDNIEQLKNFIQDKEASLAQIDKLIALHLKTEIDEPSTSSPSVFEPVVEKPVCSHQETESNSLSATSIDKYNFVFKTTLIHKPQAGLIPWKYPNRTLLFNLKLKMKTLFNIQIESKDEVLYSTHLHNTGAYLVYSESNRTIYDLAFETPSALVNLLRASKQTLIYSFNSEENLNKLKDIFSSWKDEISFVVK